MSDTNETVLVKYIANADPRDGTETIRLADSVDGTSRELKRGGPSLAVTREELVVLSQGFEIAVADENGDFSEESVVDDETPDLAPNSPAQPSLTPPPVTPSSSSLGGTGAQQEASNLPTTPGTSGI